MAMNLAVRCMGDYVASAMNSNPFMSNSRFRLADSAANIGWATSFNQKRSDVSMTPPARMGAGMMPGVMSSGSPHGMHGGAVGFSSPSAPGGGVPGNGSDMDDGPILSVTGNIVVFITIMVFIFLYVYAAYPIGSVQVTAAMVESASTSKGSGPYSLLPKDDVYDSRDGDEVEPEEPAGTYKPVSSKIRLFRRQLVRACTTAGFSRYRALFLGARHAVVFKVAQSITASITKVDIYSNGILLNLLVLLFIHPVVNILIAPLHCAWTHGMLIVPNAENPGFLRLYKQQFLKIVSQWKHLLAPVVIVSWAQSLSIYLPAYLSISASTDVIDKTMGYMIASEIAKNGQNAPEMPDDSFVLVFYCKLLGILALSVFLFCFLIVPSGIMLARIEAALLPAEAETVVAIDRMQDDEILSRMNISLNDGSLSTERVCVKRRLQNYFKGVSRAALRRTFIVYIKLSAIFFALFFVFSIVVGCEMYAFATPDASQRISAMISNMLSSSSKDFTFTSNDPSGGTATYSISFGNSP